MKNKCLKCIIYITITLSILLSCNTILVSALEIQAGQPFSNGFVVTSDGSLIEWKHDTTLKKETVINDTNMNYADKVIYLSNYFDELKAKKVKEIYGAVAVSSYLSTVAVLKADGTVWTRGNNYYGILGIPFASPDSPIFTKTSYIEQFHCVSDIKEEFGHLSGIAAISNITEHMLAIKRDGTIVGWGTNGWGQLGNADIEYSSRPLEIKGISNVVAVCVGSNTSYALKSDGSVWTWGKRVDSWDNYYSPVPIKKADGSIFDNVISISAGANGVAMLKSDGTVWMYGSSVRGYLGINAVGDYVLGGGINVVNPVQVKNSDETGYLENIKQIASGYLNVFAVDKNGNVWSWGANDDGELCSYKSEYLEINTFGLQEFLPIKTQLSGIECIVAENVKMALAKDGRLLTWGGAQKSVNYTSSNKEIESATLHLDANGDIVVGDYLPEIISLQGLDGNVFTGVITEEQKKTLPNKPSDWATKEIDQVIADKLIDTSMFDICQDYHKNVTRLEFCKLIVSMLLKQSDTILDFYAYSLNLNTKNFTDTQDLYVLVANAQGIVNGVGNKKFNPNGYITREEAALMLQKAYKASNLKPTLGSNIEFTDRDKFSKWATDGINFVSSAYDPTSGNKIMTGTGENQFNPKGYYTREQALVTICRLYNSLK